jgi:uncharacterized protein (TIGR00251 family)
VKVKPSAKREGVSVNADGMLEVAVSAPPEKGKVNERLVELLAEHFRVAKSKIRIVSGHTKRQKVVEINLPQDK